MSDEACPIACGACCHDHGVACVHLTPTGCRWTRDQRPEGCRNYLCGVARGVVDGVIDLAYGSYLKQWEREADKLKSDTSLFKPFEEPST